jgi:hypothetical protein
MKRILAHRAGPRPRVGARLTAPGAVPYLSGVPSFFTRALRSALRAHVARLEEPEALRDMSSWLLRERLRVEGRLRARAARFVRLPRITSHDGADELVVSVLEDDPPWTQRGPAAACPSPSMLAEEERQYYEYVGRFYEGRGAVLELGAWLGCSTRHLVHGLRANPPFAGRRVHVFDAFVWHEYMREWFDGPERPAPGASFRALFDRFTADLAPHLESRPSASPTSPTTCTFRRSPGPAHRSSSARSTAAVRWP